MAKTILIVENNALVMKVYHTALARLGCDAFLPKPINVDGFVRKVREYLG